MDGKRTCGKAWGGDEEKEYDHLLPQLEFHLNRPVVTNSADRSLHVRARREAILLGTLGRLVAGDLPERVARLVLDGEDFRMIGISVGTVNSDSGARGKASRCAARADCSIAGASGQ